MIVSDEYTIKPRGHDSTLTCIHAILFKNIIHFLIVNVYYEYVITSVNCLLTLRRQTCIIA